MTKNNTIRQTMSGYDWALLVFLSLTWAGSFLFVELALEELSPLSIVTARVVLAAACLHVLMVFKKDSLRFSLHIWQSITVMSLMGTVIPFVLIVWGQAYITAGLASILNATMPFFTVLIAHFVTHDEKAGPAKLLAVSTGLAGVTVIIGPHVLQDIGMHVWAQMAVLGSAVLYALTAIYVRRFKALGVKPLALTTGQFTVSSVILLPLVLYIDQPWTLGALMPVTWAALIGLAVISTVFAFIIYYYLIGQVGATNVSFVTFLIPVNAIWLGIVLLGETLDINQIIGMALIGIGLLVMDGRIFQKILRFFPQ